MKYFSMPADFKVNTIDRYDDLNSRYNDSRLIETYGQITSDNTFGSGRMIASLPEVDDKTFKKYIQYSLEKNIVFSYTLNPSCLGNVEFSTAGIQKIKEFLIQLNDAGVDSITVSMPSLIDIIQSFGFDFKIKASTICQISTPNKAAYYKQLQVERIVVDEDITRDFDSLENICSAFGDGVEIIINSVCLNNCAYKMFHYNHESHCTIQNELQETTDYYYLKCSFQKSFHLRNLVRLNWIRPEDLDLYANVGIHHFKIQGRHLVSTGQPLRTLEYYFKTKYSGNLLKLLTLFTISDSERMLDNQSLDGFVRKFFEERQFCKKYCEVCKYCDGFARKSTNPVRTEKINRFLNHSSAKKVNNLFADLIL